MTVPLAAPLATPAPMTGTSALTAWAVQPVALVLVAALGLWYAGALRRYPARGNRPAGGNRPARGNRAAHDRWPVRRTVMFALGLVLLLWTTNGWPQAYGRALFWVFTTQVLVLMLVVPVLLMAGQPLALLTRRPRFGPLASPLIGPLLVPAACVLLLFGPAPGWAVGSTAVDWLLPLPVIALGALVALPLTETDDPRSALAVGLALGVGVVELLIDAIPGIVMRLSTHPVSTFTAVRGPLGWAMPALADQQRAGAILWAVAETLDLPFLALVFLRWMRADARDAARVDTVLDAEEIARGGPDGSAEGGARPWWLDDPVLRERFKP